jgi:hypothetical protein
MKEDIVNDFGPNKEDNLECKTMSGQKWSKENNNKEELIPSMKDTRL